MADNPQLETGGALSDPQLPLAPMQVREALQQELGLLGPFIQQLSSTQWQMPSASAGWTIGEVVSHLNLALGLHNRVLDAAMKGWGSSGAWKTFGRLTEKVAPIASPAFNKLNSALPRLVEGALAPEVIQGQFAASSRGFRERLDRLESADLTRPIHYMGRAWPLSFFLAVVLNELSIHGWDMASRLDPDAHLSAAARSVLPAFYWSATPFMFHPWPGAQGMVQSVLRDPDFAGWWSLSTEEVRHGSGEIQANATIRGESGTFVLVLAGRIAVEDALRATSLTAEGDIELARQFLGAWKIT